MAAPCLLKDDAAKHVQNEAECPPRVVATGQESRRPPQLGRAAPWSWRAWPEVPSTLAACSVLSAHLPRPLSAVSYVLVNSLLSSLPLRKSAPFTGFHKNLHIVTLGDFEDVGWLSGGGPCSSPPIFSSSCPSLRSEALSPLSRHSHSYHSSTS